MKESNMIVRAVPKRETQKMIKALRDANLDVDKKAFGYECRHPKDENVVLFRALNGSRNYLVHMRRDLFV